VCIIALQNTNRRDEVGAAEMKNAARFRGEYEKL
jgi:hypothetical protein